MQRERSLKADDAKVADTLVSDDMAMGDKAVQCEKYYPVLASS